jgi:hypothetical protein
MQADPADDIVRDLVEVAGSGAPFLGPGEQRVGLDPRVGQPAEVQQRPGPDHPPDQDRRRAALALGHGQAGVGEREGVARSHG